MLKTTFITELTQVDTSQKEQLGSLRFENGKWYKYVKLYNDSATVAGVAGDGVAYAALTGYKTNTVVLDCTDADTKPIGAGILTAACAGTVDTEFYCWIQIKGWAELPSGGIASGADGDAIYKSTTDKVFTNGSAADDPIIGYTPDASAHYAILNCPF